MALRKNDALSLPISVAKNRIQDCSGREERQGTLGCTGHYRLDEGSAERHLSSLLFSDRRACQPKTGTGVLRFVLAARRRSQPVYPRPSSRKFPFLKGATALKISDEDLLGIPDLLKGELLVARMNELAIAEATSLQIAGVLDDLFYFDGELGAQRTGDQIRFRLWAPTARSVRLFVYDDPDAAKEIYPMVEGDSGVWEIRVGDPGWLNRKYYLYEVTVFSRLKGQIVTDVVTDPYSLGLAPDSLKSLVVDLNSAASKPDSWDLISKPALASPTDIVLYELHVRDFSIFDRTVPEKDRGKYAAFTHVFSDGMLHLWNLASAGLTHVHLLPTFDFTSVPELNEEQEIAQIDQPIAGAGFH